LNPAPKKKRQRSWTDAIKAIEAEVAKLEATGEYERFEKANAFRRVLGWLLQQNPPKGKRRSSQPPGANGAAE